METDSSMIKSQFPADFCSKTNLYGCYLDMSQCWQCHKFNSVAEADAHVFRTRTKYMRVVPVPLYVPEFATRHYLQSALICPVRIDNTSD